MTWRILALLAVFCAGSASSATSTPAPPTDLPRTTAPVIAIKNLDYQVDRSRRLLSVAPESPEAVAAHLDALLTRAQFLGTVDDLDAALAVVAGALQRVPLAAFAQTDGQAQLLAKLQLQQARVLQRLHRFDDALAALAAAEAGGQEVARQRAAIVMAQGTAGGAELVLQVTQGADNFADLTLRGTALAALGRQADADRSYAAALDHWDQITPFAPAWVAFQRGELYYQDQPQRALQSFQRSVALLPQYVTARVHLAELMAAAGDLTGAITLLQPVAGSQDPEPASRLAEFLLLAGRADEARPWRDLAGQRWQELLQRHPLAYADHAAEFYLAAGADANQALHWAQVNADNRPTTRALALLAQASLAQSKAAVTTSDHRAP